MSSRGGSHLGRSELVAAAADADPVTRLVFGWLAAKRSENTRAAYARDIGITPGRRSSRAPSWLAWCQVQGVHPVTGVTGLHRRPGPRRPAHHPPLRPRPRPDDRAHADQAPGGLVAAYLAGPAPGRGRLRRGH